VTEIEQAEKAQRSSEGASSPSGVTIRHGAIAFGGAAVGVSCLLALIVVAYVTDSDALSTIALVLAVLSFLVQMIVYVAQAWTTSQQQVRAEQIHADSAIVLARIEALTLSVREASETQNKSAQDALIEIASNAASQVGTELAEDSGETAPDPVDIQRRVAEEVQKQIATNPSLVRLSPLAGATAGTLTPMTSASMIVPGNLSRYTGGAITSGTISPNLLTNPYPQATALQRSWEEADNPVFDPATGFYKSGAEPPKPSREPMTAEPEAGSDDADRQDESEQPSEQPSE
jgi:hypothetical protein